MRTLIILKNLDTEKLQMYNPLFIHVREQVKICEWEQGKTPDEIVESMNFDIESWHEWKLILLDANPDSEIMEGIFGGKSDELSEFITYCTKYNMGKIKGFLPEHIWYIGCVGKQEVRIQSEEFVKIDEEQQYGERLRFFWYEMDKDCIPQKKYEWFCLNCLLVILVANEIPNSFVHYGYLYKINIEIEREEFIKYIIQMKCWLQKVEKIQNKKWSDLEESINKRSMLPKFTSKVCNLDARKKYIGMNKEYDPISCKDWRDESILKRKLRENRKWFIGQTALVKGILNREIVKDQIANPPQIEYCLEEFEREKIENELEIVLEDIEKERFDFDKSGLIKEYNKLEKEVEDLIEEKKFTKTYALFITVISVLEVIFWIILSWMFINKKINKTNDNSDEVILQIIDFIKEDKLAIVIAAIVIMVVMLVGILLPFMQRMWVMVKQRKYRDKKKNIKKIQSERIKYLENMITLINRYQCLDNIKKQDQNIVKKNEKNKKILLHHRDMLNNGKGICIEMEKLLSDDEKRNDISYKDPRIDFLREPEEMDYYWVFQENKICHVDLNKSGMKLKTFWNFTKHILISKTGK